MRPNVVVLATASVLLLTLTACSATAATAPPTAEVTESPTPEAPAPITCDDLVPADTVAAALVGADGALIEPVAAVNARDAFTGVLLEGLGGLACSWRVGAGMPDYNAPSDWAYLRVDVLPDAAGEWVPAQLGDGPSTDTRQIAGVEASVTGGDPGWLLSAPVGEDWVVASISAAGLTAEGGRFAGIGGGVMIDRLAEVAEAAFTTLAEADPEQLDRPTVELRQSDASCSGGLDEQGIVAAMQLPADLSVEYVMVDSTDAAPSAFEEAVRAAAGVFTCELLVDGGPLVSIATARGFASLFDRLRGPDGDVTFEPFDIADVPAGGHAEAVVRRYHDGPSTPAYLVVGDTLHEIQGDGTEAVAQAIVVQVY